MRACSDCLTISTKTSFCPLLPPACCLLWRGLLCNLSKPQGNWSFSDPLKITWAQWNDPASTTKKRISKKTSFSMFVCRICSIRYGLKANWIPVTMHLCLVKCNIPSAVQTFYKSNRSILSSSNLIVIQWRSIGFSHEMVLWYHFTWLIRASFRNVPSPKLCVRSLLETRSNKF